MRRWKAWVERELEHLVGDDDVRRDDAALRLICLRVTGPGGPPRKQLDRTFARLHAALRRHAQPKVRRAAANVLSSWPQRRAATALHDAVADDKEDAAVRAEAAEGLGWHLQFQPEGLRDRAVETLRGTLKHADAALRFWSAYALGMARAQEARADLEALAKRGDAAVWCDGWWTVSEEATDALNVLDGHPWPDRIPTDRASGNLQEQDGGF